jgi:hypothetical protein
VAELGPELAPEAIGLAEALAVLGKLVVVLFALGCIYAVDHFVRALFSTVSATVGWIPFAGKVVRAPIHKIEQKVVDSLARAEQSLDSYIAHSWHQLARLVRMLGREVESLAHDYLAVVRFLDRLWGPRAIMAVLRAVLHPIRALQRVEHAALRRLYGAEAWLRGMVVHGVFPRIGRLEHEVAHVIEPQLLDLRGRAKAIEHQLAREFAWLRLHRFPFVTTAFVGAVSLALRRLDLAWLRCKNVRKSGKFLCGLPATLLEDLLLLTLSFEMLVDPVVIAEAAVRVEDAFERVIKEIAD